MFVSLCFKIRARFQNLLSLGTKNSGYLNSKIEFQIGHHSGNFLANKPGTFFSTAFIITWNAYFFSLREEHSFSSYIPSMKTKKKIDKIRGRTTGNTMRTIVSRRSLFL